MDKVLKKSPAGWDGVGGGRRGGLSWVRCCEREEEGTCAVSARHFPWVLVACPSRFTSDPETLP